MRPPRAAPLAEDQQFCECWAVGGELEDASLTSADARFPSHLAALEPEQGIPARLALDPAFRICCSWHLGIPDLSPGPTKKTVSSTTGGRARDGLSRSSWQSGL